MNQQNRQRARFAYSAQATVRSPRKGAFKGTVRDIGQESIYITIDPVFDYEEIVEIEIVLYGHDSMMSIKANASVIRDDSHGVAMHFTSPLEWWPVFSLFPFYGVDMALVEDLGLL